MAELTKLGRYQLRRVLGRGAMGVVYEGFDPTLGRRVAVKTILRNAAIDAETERAYSARFVQEAKAVARLNHPHIVQVHDFGEENDVAFLVMEFIQGRELRSFFDAGERFELAEAGRIMGELLDALEFAHESGVIHRDVKPANVMLDAQRRAKLTDFGVARVQDSDRSAAGTMVGTPAFMSPEQIQGQKVDRRTDIFSAGVVLYQLLTGEQPFTGEGAWTVAKKIMQDDPPRPSSLAKSVSPAYDAIVARALAKSPAQRYGSAKEFAGALRDAASGAPASPVSIPKPKAKAAPAASEAEVEFWRSIQGSNDPAEFEVYLEQFPEGTYAQLARIKIGKLREAKAPDSQATLRPDAEAEAERRAAQEAAALQAKAEAEARARWEAAENAQREAEEKSRREAAERAKREAEERARREAEQGARRAAQAKAEAEARARKVAEELAQRQAAEKAKREAEERARQAQALARLKQQQEAAERARKPAVDEDATVAMGGRQSAAAAPESPRSSKAIPAAIALAIVAAAVGAYFYSARKPAPPPVAEVPAPAPTPAPKPEPKPEITAADLEKIKKETEERVRKEDADKFAAEQAAAAKAAAEKALQEKQLAAKAAAEKAAVEKAAAEKARAEQLAAAKLANEKTALEKAATERAAAEKAAADKAAAEKAAAAKATVAGKPGWPAVGDRWTYEARDARHPDKHFSMTVEVRAVGAAGVQDAIRTSGKGEVERVNRMETSLVSVAPGVLQFLPYLRAFHEPHVGDRWRKLTVLGSAFCQQAQTCDASARIVGKEKVTVKAGSFDAWIVEVDLIWSWYQMYAGRGKVTFRYWYADAVKRYVKYQSRATTYQAPSWTQDWNEDDIDMELVSRRPAGSK